MMQLDLFAAPKAPAPMTAIGAVEILCQGKKQAEHPHRADPGLWLSLTTTAEGVLLHGSYDVQNQGGTGPSSRTPLPDRTAALVYAARWAIRHCAHDVAMGEGWSGDYVRNAKLFRAMVDWLADMLPPMFSGFDAYAELEAMTARAIEKETARCEQLMRMHERQKLIVEPLHAAKAYGYPDLIRVPGVEPWAWIGRWKDDGETVTISRYRDEQEAHPALAQLAAAIEANGLAVVLA